MVAPEHHDRLAPVIDRVEACEQAPDLFVQPGHRAQVRSLRGADLVFVECPSFGDLGPVLGEQAGHLFAQIAATGGRNRDVVRRHAIGVLGWKVERRMRLTERAEREERCRARASCLLERPIDEERGQVAFGRGVSTARGPGSGAPTRARRAVARARDAPRRWRARRGSAERATPRCPRSSRSRSHARATRACSSASCRGRRAVAGAGEDRRQRVDLRVQHGIDLGHTDRVRPAPGQEGLARGRAERASDDRLREHRGAGGESVEVGRHVVRTQPVPSSPGRRRG